MVVVLHHFRSWMGWQFAFTISLALAVLIVPSSPLLAQQQFAQKAVGKIPPPVRKPETDQRKNAEPLEAKPEIPLPPERVEADVSARAIAVTAAFKGSEIIVFGTVDNSRQPSPESGYYDVVVALEGGSLGSIVRRKSNIGGIWINDDEAKFESAPAFYAVSATRPIEEIADAEVLAQNGIGTPNLRIIPKAGTETKYAGDELRDFSSALIRLKTRDALYARDDYGVLFTGRSLFRSTIELPANVPVGNLVARVFLFREGVMLSRFTTRVSLERAGVERWIFDAAHKHSWLYGIFTVLTALGCGLAAASFFGRNGR